MKKIIAAAVATAFVAPAFAAEITISGFTELAYSDAETTTTTTESVVEESAVKVTATTEIAGGVTVTTDLNIQGAGGNDGGNSITLAGSFGTLAIGDENGAIDSFDKGDIFFIAANKIGAGGSDASVNWTLPTLAEGLTLVAAYSPKEGTVSEDASNQVSGDLSGFGVRYTFGAGSVAYAVESVDTTDNTFAQVTYSVGGLGVMYEMNEADVAGSKTDYTAATLTYSMGDTTFAAGKKSTKADGASKTVDQTVVGIHQNLGGGVTAFVESSNDDTATTKPSTTALGLSYSF